MLRILRDRSQAGRLERDGDPGHRQRPVRGAARAERGACGCRAGAGFGFPADGEPDRVIPVPGSAGPALPFPGRVRHVRVEPGQVPAFRFDVAPCALNARAADQPHPAVRTHRDHHLALHASASPGALLTRAGRTARCRRPR